MRFVMLMIPQGYATAQPGTVPDAKIVAMMMKHTYSCGKRVCCARLMASTCRFHGRAHILLRREAQGDRWTVSQAKEVVGGYWIIEVKSKEEAVEWASRCPASGRPIRGQRRVGRGATHRTPVRIGEKVRVRTVAPKLGKRNAEIFGRLVLPRLTSPAFRPGA